MITLVFDTLFARMLKPPLQGKLFTSIHIVEDTRQHLYRESSNHFEESVWLATASLIICLNRTTKACLKSRQLDLRNMICHDGLDLTKTAHGEINLCALFACSSCCRFSNQYYLVCSACCASLFTWASTSNTEAQAARDKHNCRSCGGLVCNPCSKNKIPIPSIGITQSVRVCDRCYNGWGSLYSSMKSDKNVADCEHKRYGNKSSREHSRRSRVVDELASRLPTIVKH